MQTTPDGQPQFVCLHRQPFTHEEVAVFAARSIAASATVGSDRLWCFGAVQIVGAQHERVVTDGGKASTKQLQFKAIYTFLGNLKCSLGGTYQAFDFAKYAHHCAMWAMPCGTTSPILPSSPRIWLACAVRALTKPWRNQCSASTDRCSTILIGTKRIVGLTTASQIASASAASFLLLLKYGLTNWGAMSRTVCPSACGLRAHWCALDQASMPIRHAGRFAKNAAT